MGAATFTTMYSAHLVPKKSSPGLHSISSLNTPSEQVKSTRLSLLRGKTNQDLPCVRAAGEEIV